jgi:hypothetical protein
MSAEIPGVLWSPAHQSRVRLRPQAQFSSTGQPHGPYDVIIIHITDGSGNFQNTLDEWATPGITCAQFLVGQQGEAAQTMSIKFAAEHSHDLNSHSIGIEHECRSDNQVHGLGVLAPSDLLYQKSAFVSAYLLKAAGLPIILGQTIGGHKQMDSKTNHDDCPLGCGWDWDRYLPLVQAQYDLIGTVPAIV